jgi:hypothetical protein
MFVHPMGMVENDMVDIVDMVDMLDIEDIYI